MQFILTDMTDSKSDSDLAEIEDDYYQYSLQSGGSVRLSVYESLAPNRNANRNDNTSSSLGNPLIVSSPSSSGPPTGSGVPLFPILDQSTSISAKRSHGEDFVQLVTKKGKKRGKYRTPDIEADSAIDPNTITGDASKDVCFHR